MVLATSQRALAQEPASTPPTIEQRVTSLETQMSESKPAADGLRVFWKDGLRMESADKRYKFKIGGRLHYDAGLFSPDDDTKAAVETGTTRIEDGSEIRRARIEMSGEVGRPHRLEHELRFRRRHDQLPQPVPGPEGPALRQPALRAVQGALRPRADHQQRTTSRSSSAR